MDLLKKIFPLAFTNKPTVASLVIQVIIYVVVGCVISLVCALIPTFGISILDFILTAIAALIDLYITATIVLTFLHYFKVIK